MLSINDLNSRDIVGRITFRENNNDDWRELRKFVEFVQEDEKKKAVIRKTVYDNCSKDVCRAM